MALNLRRAWKSLPTPVRRSANEAVQAFGRATLPLQVARRWRRGSTAQAPIVVAGLHRAVLGLGQGARLFTEALRQGGFEVHALDASAALARPVGIRDPGRSAAVSWSALPPGGVLVSHLNPPELELYLMKTEARPLEGRRHIGYWAWELPKTPPEWRRAFAFVDEVWCPSRFTADALRSMAPPHTPVRVVPHPMFVMPEIMPDRARFGFPDQACIVLQAFDLRSTAARKNPFGALDAYLLAVPTPGPAARLVCKVIGADAFPDILDALKARLDGRPDLILINEELSPDDMLRLVASADIILSLHRAEGFGLLMAEGMWLGKPVVATAWSGNMDFMDADSAALVGFTLVAADDPQGMYQGAKWAEPDLHEAAERLRELIADPLARAALGERARAQAERAFGREAWFATVCAALGAAQAAG